jgi:Putative Ig domain
MYCLIRYLIWTEQEPSPDHGFFGVRVRLQLIDKGLSLDVIMKIPRYLDNSRLFSRLDPLGNHRKSQGQLIWRVWARRRNDIPDPDAPPNGAFQIWQEQQLQHEEMTNGLMMASDPLLWEFLPYECSIVGQPPLAIVGTSWQWNMKVDPWPPHKKVSWSLVSNAASTTANGSSYDKCDPSSPLSVSTSSSNALPRWLSLDGSRLKGTPTEPGIYPITIEATSQEDNDPEPVVVRGNYTIQVAKAI